MAKITLNNLTTNFGSQALHNANNDTVEDHLNNKVLYRDNPAGEPNAMQQELDMNSNRIINIGDAVNAQDAVTFKQFLNAGTLNTSVYMVEEVFAFADFTVGTGITTITTTTDMVPGVNNLMVFVNGVAQPYNIGYTVVDTNELRINAELGAEDAVLLRVGVPDFSDIVSAANVTYAPQAGAATNVQSHLHKIDTRTSVTANVKEYGAVGNGVANDTAAFTTALSLSTDVFVPEGTYSIASKLVPTERGIEIKGAGTGYLHGKSVLQPVAALADYVIETSTTYGSMTFRNLEIDGQASTNLLGGVYLKDDGSSTNTSNKLENVRVRGISTDDATAIKVEAWGTTLDHVFVRQIFRGTGITFGASGVTGTTQYLHRPYLGECDVCVVVSGTTLGVTMVNPIMESSTVGYYQRSNEVVMLSPYFENANRPNNDGVNYSSLNRLKVQNNAGQPVDYFIYLDGSDAQLSIFGGRLAGLNNVDNSKFLGVGSNSKCILDGFRFPSNFDERHIAEIGTGIIEIRQPKGLNVESVKNSVSYIDHSANGYRYELRNGKCVSYGGAAVPTTLSRSIGDRHFYETVNGGVDSSVVNYAATLTATSAVTTTVTVASAAALLAGDYVAVRMDNRLWHYTTIASIATNTLTLSAAPSSTTSSGAEIRVWRWSTGTGVQAEKPQTTVDAAASETILSGIPLDGNVMQTIVVVVTQSNTIQLVQRLYLENRNGTGLNARSEEAFRNGTYTAPGFGWSESGGFASITMTNNDDASCTVSAKAVDTMRLV